MARPDSTGPGANYCDKSIKISRKAYNLILLIRDESEKRAVAGLPVGFRYQLGLGHVVEVALQRLAEQERMLPVAKGRAL
ncbi:MAG: hypothetical protein WCC69_11780 [Pirellulales bacterium]